MSNSTITIQNVANFCSTHVDLLPLSGVGGYVSEPFLSIANDIMSDLLMSQMDWKFNRIEMPAMVTAANKQDYTVAGAIAFTLGNTTTGAHIGLSTTPAISVASGTVTVTTLEPHRFNTGDTVYLSGVVMTTGTTSKYNSVLTDSGTSSLWSNGWTILSTPTPTTFTFAATTGQNNADAGGAPGIFDFGWLASAYRTQLNDNSSPRYGAPMQAKRDLGIWNKVANPDKVAVMTDNGDGTLKVRFQYVPGATIWLIDMTYQAKPPLKVALTDTWAPIPDQFGAVIRQAALYRCYRYLGDAKETSEYQKLQQEIAKTQGAEDREQSDVTVVPEDSLIDNGWFQ